MEGLLEGRMVHFVNGHGLHQPAVIVMVHHKASGLCNLQVFTNSADGTRWETSVSFSEEKTPGTWHWIERA